MEKKINEKEFEAKFEEYRFGDNSAKIENDEVLQKYLRMVYDQIKHDNNLLGDFSVYGTYQIESLRMIDFLKKVPKKLQTKSGWIVKATSVLPEIVLNFNIYFDIAGQSQKAILELEEREIRYDQDDLFHKTKLAEIVKFNMPNFVEYVYKEWNVGLDAVDRFLEDDFLTQYILERKRLYTKINPLLMVSAQLYMLNMTSFLGASCGVLGATVLHEYNTMFGGMLVKNPLLQNDFAFQKNLLDRIMLKNGIFNAIANLPGVGAIFQEFTAPFKDIGKMFSPKVTTLKGPDRIL